LDSMSSTYQESASLPSMEEQIMMVHTCMSECRLAQEKAKVLRTCLSSLSDEIIK